METLAESYVKESNDIIYRPNVQSTLQVMRRYNSDGIMLAHRLGRRPNLTSKLVQLLLFTGLKCDLGKQQAMAGCIVLVCLMDVGSVDAYLAQNVPAHSGAILNLQFLFLRLTCRARCRYPWLGQPNPGACLSGHLAEPPSCLSRAPDTAWLMQAGKTTRAKIYCWGNKHTIR